MSDASPECAANRTSFSDSLAIPRSASSAEQIPNHRERRDQHHADDRTATSLSLLSFRFHRSESKKAAGIGALRLTGFEN
jgi:hypothetical protein